jgi:hypothetical protein
MSEPAARRRPWESLTRPSSRSVPDSTRTTIPGKGAPSIDTWPPSGAAPRSALFNAQRFETMLRLWASSRAMASSTADVTGAALSGAREHAPDVIFAPPAWRREARHRRSCRRPHRPLPRRRCRFGRIRPECRNGSAGGRGGAACRGPGEPRRAARRVRQGGEVGDADRRARAPGIHPERRDLHRSGRRLPGEEHQPIHRRPVPGSRCGAARADRHRVDGRRRRAGARGGRGARVRRFHRQPLRRRRRPHQARRGVRRRCDLCHRARPPLDHQGRTDGGIPGACHARHPDRFESSHGRRRSRGSRRRRSSCRAQAVPRRRVGRDHEHRDDRPARGHRRGRPIGRDLVPRRRRIRAASSPSRTGAAQGSPAWGPQTP